MNVSPVRTSVRVAVCHGARSAAGVGAGGGLRAGRGDRGRGGAGRGRRGGRRGGDDLRRGGRRRRSGWCSGTARGGDEDHDGEQRERSRVHHAQSVARGHDGTMTRPRAARIREWTGPGLDALVASRVTAGAIRFRVTIRTMDMTVAVAPRIGRAHAFVAMARPSQVALVVLVFAPGVLLGGSRAAPAVDDAMDVAVARPCCCWRRRSPSTGRTRRRTRRRTPARSAPPFSGGSGALARSTLDPRPAAAAVAGAGGRRRDWPRSWRSPSGRLGPVAASLLLVGLVGGLAYSLPPVAAMRRGWGELLNALLGGLALPLYGVAVVRGRVEPLDVVAFLPFTAVVWCSVLATAWPDREADARDRQADAPGPLARRPAAAAPCGDRARLAGRDGAHDAHRRAAVRRRRPAGGAAAGAGARVVHDRLAPRGRRWRRWWGSSPSSRWAWR